jgi:hypothetical protein
MERWWAHQARYHLNDQICLVYLLSKHPEITVSVVDAHIYKTPYLRFLRGRA